MRIVQFFFLVALFNSTVVRAQSIEPQEQVIVEKQIPKQLYVPKDVWRVSGDNDYDNPESEFSNSRKLESANISIFWSKEYGANPLIQDTISKRFDPKEVLDECERIYTYFTDTLKFLKDPNSLSNHYKLLIYIIGGNEGTAYGGGAEEKVGVIWTSAARIQNKPFAVLAHEMTHCLQYLAKCDGAYAYSSPIEGSGSKGHAIFEMTAQYMLWQMYPTWIQFENYHLNGFLEKNHLSFLHEANMYHSPFVLEYWSQKHGLEFIGKLWHEAMPNEDPVMTYKRLTGISQEQFNDEMFDAYRRFITWDLGRVSQVASQYRNGHKTPKILRDNNKYTVESEQQIMDYGYHAIALTIPAQGRTIEVDFKGLPENAMPYSESIDRAGWRYGVVASQKNGTTIYSPAFSKSQSIFTFDVPQDTDHLWLVVCGAPIGHRVHTVDGDNSNDSKWPYEFTLKNTGILTNK